MSGFDYHFRMSAEDAAEYAAEKLEIFAPGAALRCEEIGNGNINYVFRVWDEGSDASVIIKHADEAIRSNPERVLGLDRGRIEAEILAWEYEQSPGMAPRVLLYDPVMGCLCMEDLSEYAIMRDQLCRHEIVPDFDESISGFLVNTLLPTTDIVLDPAEKKRAVAKYINPGPCKITEDLVFTDPFGDAARRNEVSPENYAFVMQHIYSDRELRCRAGQLKDEFMNNAQALIHGDLHTGSIFVRGGDIRVIDPEFACYAPMGYDLGNVVGNLVLAWGNALVTLPDDDKKLDYMDWLEHTIAATVDKFSSKFRKAFAALARDPLRGGDDFRQWYLRDVLRYAAGVAGCETLRRVIGNAKVIDTTSIADDAARLRAERVLIICAKSFIMQMEGFAKGKDFVAVLRRWAGEDLS